MTTSSLIFCDYLIFRPSKPHSSLPGCTISHNFQLQLSLSYRRKRTYRRIIPNASKSNRHNPKKSWWKSFFFDDDGNWLGLEEDDMLDEDEDARLSDDEEELSEADKFEAWKRRAEAIVELREAQEDMMNEESRRWEDWIVDDPGSWESGQGEVVTPPPSPPSSSDRGLIESVGDWILGRDDDDILYEDRVFRYASINSAKFLAVLILVPWALDFAVHDYVLMPFLDRYVKTVPLAAQMLDVRRNQKLEMVKDLKTEKAKLQFEMEIGRSPPLSDEDVWWELRHKALDLQEEWRLENRRSFANIWSDMIFGVSLFTILYFNQNKVALLKFTGYKITNNISDTGKAFLIILITDIFLGYHSESGWKTLLEVVAEHYGLEVDPSAITIFVCLVPVIIDACVKLWMFKFLPKLSPVVANIFQEMRRH